MRKSKKNKEKYRLIKNYMALKEEKTAVSAVFLFIGCFFAHSKHFFELQKRAVKNSRFLQPFLLVFFVTDILFLGRIKGQVANRSNQPVNAKGDHRQKEICGSS